MSVAPNRVRIGRSGFPIPWFVLLLSTLSACRPDAPSPETAPPAPRHASPASEGASGGLEFPVPDVSGRNRVVAQQIREREAWFEAILERPETPPDQRAQAHGELGQLYHAYDFGDAAAARYREAQRLAPADFRWPYYLGQLHRSANRLEESVAAFEQALSLAPTDVPTLVRLGEVLVDLNRQDQGEPYLKQAIDLDAGTAAAHAALAQIALAREDYSAAVEHCEAALAAQPAANAVHHPLGIAYRELGHGELASRHLALAGDHSVTLDDPLLLVLHGLSAGQLEAAARGSQALEEGRLDAAIADLERAVAMDPLFSRTRILLGRALVAGQQLEAARRQFEIALRLAPATAPPNFHLGHLAARAGQLEEAARLYRRGLEAEPDNAAAQIELARILSGLGRDEEALVPFSAVLRLQPKNRVARLGLVNALVNLERFAEAREELERGLAALSPTPEPETAGADPLLAHALARLLAAAPDETTRDGERALPLALELAREAPTPARLEAVAMSFAELGRYADAIEWQRRAIASARKAGVEEVVRMMAENLSSFEQSRPSRRPWTRAGWELLPPREAPPSGR
jgi:tetratricopeptide (TPR) repeat protein